MKHDYAHVLPKPNELWCQNSAIVVLFGKNRVRRYVDGKEVDSEEMTYMPYAVQNVTDLDHVDLMRKRKGYGVAGVEFLENVKNRAQAAKIRHQIELLTKSPEMEAEMKAKDERIAELEAKLASLEAPKTEVAPRVARAPRAAAEPKEGVA